MNQKREHLRVIFDILSTVQKHHNSIRPTPLMRHSNLSTQSFKRYQKELLEKGLIKEVTDQQGQRYITLTDKGFRYVERYNLLVGFIEEFEV